MKHNVHITYEEMHICVNVVQIADLVITRYSLVQGLQLFDHANHIG